MRIGLQRFYFFKFTWGFTENRKKGWIGGGIFGDGERKKKKEGLGCGRKKLNIFDNVYSIASNWPKQMEVTKNDVEKLIELRKENTFLNHLSNVFSQDFRPKGEIGQSEIKVWRQNMWNATFYPIFTFEFNTNNHLINITAKLNPIGKMLIGIFTLIFLYLILPKNLYDFELKENWLIIAIIIVFVSIIILVARMLYNFEKKNQLEQILEILDVEVEEKKPEKEWSLKNILIRLFTYPFCLFLIGLNIFLIIPNRQYILALGTFGFVGFYLFADIKMILKNKKTTGKKGYK